MVTLFYNDKEYRIKIDHVHDTGRKNDGRFKVAKYNNTYRKFTLPTLIPSLMNNLPVDLLNILSLKRRNVELKSYFLNTQK